MLRRTALVLAVLVAALAALACGSDEEEAPDAGLLLADRWVRLGEDLQAGVQVYERSVPPGFSRLLNPDATDETPEEDLVSLPVHPAGELLGSFHVERPQGLSLVWLVFDVPERDSAVAEAVSRQLDGGAWQVTGGQSTESLSVVRFQSTRAGTINGTAVVQPLPAADAFAVTVERDDGEVTLQVPRGAPVPRLTAELGEEDDGVVVRRVSGVASEAGLREDDRLVSVAGEPVKTIADLDRALRAMAEEEPTRATVVYILEIEPEAAAREPAFALPQSQPLPDGFPASSLVRDDMTVVEVGWQSEAAGSVYQVTLLSDDSTTDVADAMRDAIEAEGWSITDDRAIGFATVLQFQSEDGSLQGGLTVDAFAQDDDYTAVQLQVQRARGSGQ